MPHLWCAGCGHGTVLNGLVRSVDELGLKKREIVMVSGIGYSARMAEYLDFHTLHTLHGRALAFATGATFVARTTTFHVHQMQQILTQAIQHKGFSVVEVLSQCPTHFGRKNGGLEAVDMLKGFQQDTASVGAKKLENSPDLIPVGVFVDEERAE